MSKVDIGILTEDKRDIVNENGNVLVVANPGTGKTFLLTFKYCQLIEQGVKPEEILALTFTNKAKGELEEGILKSISNYNLDVDLSKVNVHTFHSYANEILGDLELVSPNLLRYLIYRYIKEKEIFNYENEYLLEKIVPKIENSIRYLKNFGILPESVSLDEVKVLLSDFRKVGKEEMDKYAEYFLDIFRYYEEVKNRRGIDYGDMLIECNKQDLPKYKYVLIDELQDVNRLEAEIALKSSEKFIAVGDKKQAIFGFQGGSISNFELFEDAKKFTLSLNSRSTQEVLNYAREFFLSKTSLDSYREELLKLVSSKNKHGDLPRVLNVSNESAISVACSLATKLKDEGREVAVIARKNSQIMELSKEFKKMGVSYSSTFSQSSKDMKNYIISFLEGILSNDILKIKNSMFTPFFPIDLKKAFFVSEDKGLTLEKIYTVSPVFKELRGSIKELRDLEKLFDDIIIPVSMRYGKEGFFSAKSVYSAVFEALKILKDINLSELIDYIKSSGFDSKEEFSNGKINLITAHKSKGLQFQDVIYLPKETKNNNFQDYLTKSVLSSVGVDVEEELLEDNLRIDFVSMTRAKENLYILTDKLGAFFNDFSEEMKMNDVLESRETFLERNNRAFNLFLQGDFETAKDILSGSNLWIIDFVKNHFKNLDRFSFSKLNVKVEDYLKYNLLNLQKSSFSMALGSEVHSIAENLLNKKDVDIKKVFLGYKNNIEKLLLEIKKDFFEVFSTEEKFEISLKDLFGIDSEIVFKGSIDAVFKNDSEYLIVDWKTSKNVSKASQYRRQLEGYRYAFSRKHNIPLEKIKIAIGFVGLKGTINMDSLDCWLDIKQPRSNVIFTLKKHIEKVLEWKNNPLLFFEELKILDSDDFLVKEIVQQYEEEKNRIYS